MSYRFASTDDTDDLLTLCIDNDKHPAIGRKYALGYRSGWSGDQPEQNRVFTYAQVY